MPNFNAVIGGRGGAGARRVWVAGIHFPLEIIASADSQARSRRAFYPVTTDGSSFSVDLVFATWAQRESFNQWMNSFMVAVSEGTSKYGTLTVRVPNRNFVRVGVPQGQLEYGEGVTDVGYTATLTFVGSHDPVDPDLSRKMQGVSYFKGPGKETTSSYFYPLGQQVKGAESLDGSLFDPTPSQGGYNLISPSDLMNNKGIGDVMP